MAVEKNNVRRIAFGIAAGVLLFLFLAAFRRVAVRTVSRFGRDFFYPYWSVAAGGRTVLDRSLLLSSKTELARRLEELERRNRVLAAQGAVAGELARQNDELRRLLGVPASPEWRYIPAEIILRDPVHWLQEVTLNRGRRHGVKTGAAVFYINAEGHPFLIGLVEECSGNTSQVATVYSPKLQLSASLPHAGASGMLNPANSRPTGGNLRIGFLPTTLDYTIEEGVETTGFESNVPAGLKIGNLSSIERIDSSFTSSLYLAGLVKPAADLNRLRFVMIAQRREREPVRQ